MQSAPVRFLIGLGYATRSKRLRTAGLVLRHRATYGASAVGLKNKCENCEKLNGL